MKYQKKNLFLNDKKINNIFCVMDNYLKCWVWIWVWISTQTLTQKNKYQIQIQKPKKKQIPNPNQNPNQKTLKNQIPNSRTQKIDSEANLPKASRLRISFGTSTSRDSRGILAPRNCRNRSSTAKANPIRSWGSRICAGY